jgi:membrane protease YdiL (CAAX protease family)
MAATERNTQSQVAPATDRRALRWAGLVFALGFPTLITWGYFVFAGRYSMGVQQTVYLTVKVIQFAFPAAWTLLVLREPLRTARPTVKGLALGAAFSIVVVGAGMLVFQYALRELPIFTKAAELIEKKITGFGITTAGAYFLLGGFYSLFHSLLEEYYWRWFVFQQLKKLTSLWPAIAISAIGFALHHVVVLSMFFRGLPWLVAAFAAATAIGGAFWAWLYNRSGSIFDTWLSHLLIDAGLFFGIGYQMVQHMFATAG